MWIFWEKAFLLSFFMETICKADILQSKGFSRKVLSSSLLDSLGHGKSGELQGEASFAYLSDSLDELLSSLSIEKCLLVGHSDGANLALEYAGRHGERVAGILANSGNISFSGLKFLPRYACYLEEWLYRFWGSFFLPLNGSPEYLPFYGKCGCAEGNF